MDVLYSSLTFVQGLRIGGGYFVEANLELCLC